MATGMPSEEGLRRSLCGASLAPRLRNVFLDSQASVAPGDSRARGAGENRKGSAHGTGPKVGLTDPLRGSGAPERRLARGFPSTARSEHGRGTEDYA